MIRTINNYTIDDITTAMRDFLHKAQQSKEVRDLALNITATEPDPVIAIHHWVRSNVRYIPDPVQGEHFIEQFTAPTRLVADYLEGKSIGEDCDSHAMLVVALCQSIGIQSHVILADYSGNGWEHAYAQVWSDKLNAWVDVDTTIEQPMGWLKIPKNTLAI